MSRLGHLLASGAVLLLLVGIAAYGSRDRPMRDHHPLSFRTRLDDRIQQNFASIRRLSATSPKVASAGSRAHVISDDEHVSVPSGDAVDVVEALLSDARSGDAKAALAIYAKLSSCRPESDDTAINSRILTGEDDGKIAAYLDGHRQSCIGIEGLLPERGSWLESAAASGLPEAQLLYAIDSEAIVGTREQGIRNPERLAQYKARSAGYLNELAATGNVDAMLALSAVYENGTLLKLDPVRSYAYGRAAQLAAPNLVPHDMLDRQREALSTESLAEGERLGRAILATCCNSPRKEN